MLIFRGLEDCYHPHDLLAMISLPGIPSQAATFLHGGTKGPFAEMPLEGARHPSTLSVVCSALQGGLFQGKSIRKVAPFGPRFALA